MNQELKELERRIENREVSISEAHEINKKFHRIYYSKWNPRDSGQKERTENWTISKNLFLKLANKIWSEFKEKYPSKTSYAYSPRENVNSGGCSHIVMKEEASFGRRKREAHDPLCKKRKHFWMLSDVSDSEPTCIVCLRVAEDILKKSTLTK